MERDEDETKALKGTYNDSLSEAARAGSPEKGSQSSLEALASLMQMREEDAEHEMVWMLSQSGTMLHDKSNSEYNTMTASFQGDDNGI